jgi:hypothetical protein
MFKDKRQNCGHEQSWSFSFVSDWCLLALVATRVRIEGGYVPLPADQCSSTAKEDPTMNGADSASSWTAPFQRKDQHGSHTDGSSCLLYHLACACPPDYRRVTGIATSPPPPFDPVPPAHNAADCGAHALEHMFAGWNPNRDAGLVGCRIQVAILSPCDGRAAGSATGARGGA